MGGAEDARLANLLGALATGLSDAMRDAGRDTVQLADVDAVALVAMLDFSPAGTVQALSQICGLTHSGGVRLVDRLVVAGCATRGPGRSARSVTVALTPAGRTAALELRSARHEAIATTMGDLTRRQREELVRASTVLIRSLTLQRLARRAAGEPPASGALCRLCDFGACQRSDDKCPAARAVRRYAGS